MKSHICDFAPCSQKVNLSEIIPDDYKTFFFKRVFK